MHESQQTTPRATTHHRHIQTDIHAIVQLPSFAGIMPTSDTNQPATSLPTASSTFPTASPNPTSATNKQPHHRHLARTAAHSSNISLPHRRRTAQQTFQDTSSHNYPTRTRQPDPRTGSPTPQRTTPATTRQPSQATVHPLPKRPPPSLFQAQQPPATTEPLQPVVPATGWPCFQGGSYTPTPTVAPPATTAPPTHPWPAHYQIPTQQPSVIPPQASSTALAPPSPVVMLHPSTTRVDRQGRPLPLSQQDYDPDTDPWHADNH